MENSINFPCFKDSEIKDIQQGKEPLCSTFYAQTSRYGEFLVRCELNKHRNIYFLYDDLMEGINYALGMALSCYNPNVKKECFKNYCIACMQHEMSKIIKDSFKQKKNSVSIDIEIKPTSDKTYHEVVGKNDEYIIGTINAKETLASIQERNETVLSEEQRAIFGKRLAGHSFKSIAESLGTNEKHVRYVYAAAKTKLLLD